jgi:DNA-binding transcriptional regulator YiaG
MPPKPRHTDEVREWTTPVGDDNISPARAWRAASGLTQADAAAQLGVAVRTLTRWETGEVEPRGLNLIAYHRFLTKTRPKAEGDR